MSPKRREAGAQASIGSACVPFHMAIFAPLKNKRRERESSFFSGHRWILRASEVVAWFFQYNDLQHRGKEGSLSNTEDPCQLCKLRSWVIRWARVLYSINSTRSTREEKGAHISGVGGEEPSLWPRIYVTSIK